MKNSLLTTILTMALGFSGAVFADSATQIACTIDWAEHFIPPYVLIIHESEAAGLSSTFEVKRQPTNVVVASGLAVLVNVAADSSETWDLNSESGNPVGTLHTGQFGPTDGNPTLTWSLDLPSSVTACSQSPSN